MDFSSRQFYEGALQAHDSVRGRLLADLPGVAANSLTQSAVEFIDTAGAGYDEQLEPGGESRRNPQEASLAARKVRALLETGLPAEFVEREVAPHLDEWDERHAIDRSTWLAAGKQGLLGLSAAWALSQGAGMVRVHDVAPTVEAAALVGAASGDRGSR